MWFSPRTALTFNCVSNFIVGDRGGGKSFNTLDFVISRYLKTGEEFIYLRRQQAELDETKPTLFDWLKKEGKYPDHSLYVKGGQMYCDDKVMGYMVALSTSMKKKSVSYANVKWIIFEEFMVDGVTSRYLGHGDQEVTLFNNFYESVDRGQDRTRVFFIGNAFSMANIYFTHYKIRIQNFDKIYHRFGNILVVMWRDEAYREARQKTKFYQLNQGTAFNQHAFESKFILDSDHFIKSKTPQAEFNFALCYLGKTYGVWADWDKGVYYVSTKTASLNAQNTISLSMEDNRPNNMNIRRCRSMPFMLRFRRAVDENMVYYDSLETYALLNEAIYLLKTTH